ncbi:MAG: cobyrinate a,c-diamide synthase [Methyloprofundus sp.]|nr:cobyrinate a,c-diamide synthase [Methyloprofundus sp.]
MKAALLAGTQSGCGKTTMMLAVLQYLTAQQHRVISFKAGPDFLDPLWHQAITGKCSYNLDTRMIGAANSRQLLAKQAATADAAVIEGAMGLFDGRSGVGASGSSAALAQALQVPVFLVVDAKGMSGSMVPLVSGFCAYAEKMGVTIVGIIANRVGSAHHASLLKAVLQEHQQPPLIAWMAKDAPVLPERHLGLVRPSEAVLPDFLPFFHVEVENLLALFADVNRHFAEQNPGQLLKGKKIAIAQDAACCFIYPANLEFLQAQGAALLFFSPVAGDAIPESADTLWLPGGYPELFAGALSRSNTWASLRVFIDAGKPVLAECGGAMLLGEALIDLDGTSWAMANILPFRSKMQTKLASLGYREDASGIKGHEFHHSVRESEQKLAPYLQTDRGDQGVRYKRVRASYVHWYFASAPEVICKWLSEN